MIERDRCTGDVIEWTKCSYFTRTPTRNALDIPEDSKGEYGSLHVPFLLFSVNRTNTRNEIGSWSE